MKLLAVGYNVPITLRGNNNNENQIQKQLNNYQSLQRKTNLSTDRELNPVVLPMRNLPLRFHAVDAVGSWTVKILRKIRQTRTRMRHRLLRSLCPEFYLSMLPFFCSFVSTKLYAPTSLTSVTWRSWLWSVSPATVNSYSSSTGGSSS